MSEEMTTQEAWRRGSQRGPGRLRPPPHHDRSHHPPRRARQDRHLPRRRGGRGARLLPGARSCAASRSSPRAVPPRTCRRSPRASAGSAPRRTTWPRPRPSTPSTRSTRRRRRRRSASWSTSAFMVEDHALHFYFLGGPDFVVGPEAPAARAQHPRRHRQGGRGGRPAGDRHAPPPPGDHHARSAARSSTRCWASPAAWPSAVTAEQQAVIKETAADARGLRPASPSAAFRSSRAGQPGVRGPDPLRRLHPSHLLHGPDGREEPAQLLRRRRSASSPRRGASAPSSRRPTTWSTWPSTSSPGAT